MSSTRKKSISQKNVERERTENRTLNRVYYVFLLGLAAESGRAAPSPPG